MIVSRRYVQVKFGWRWPAVAGWRRDQGVSFSLMLRCSIIDRSTPVNCLLLGFVKVFATQQSGVILVIDVTENNLINQNMTTKELHHERQHYRR
jgi:hypothetical protein